VPRLSVRRAVGMFPHVALDTMDVVAKKSLLHVHVDFAVEGVLLDAAAPCVRAAHPPRSGARGAARHDASEVTARSKCRLKMPPADARGPLRTPVPHTAFFRLPIRCEVRLAFADTLEEVPDSQGRSPAIESNRGSRKRRAPSVTYTSLDGEAHPAYFGMRVNRLSSREGNRAFVLKVVGSTACKRGISHKLLSYSTPFVVAANRTAAAAAAAACCR